MKEKETDKQHAILKALQEGIFHSMLNSLIYRSGKN